MSRNCAMIALSVLAFSALFMGGTQAEVATDSIRERIDFGLLQSMLDDKLAQVGMSGGRRLLESQESGEPWYAGATVDLTNAFWNFGADGVRVYGVEGTLRLHLKNTDICLKAVSRGVTSQNCGFRDAKPAGRFVIATNTQGGSFVEVFSVEHGRHVGSIPTCNSPYFIDYAPHREEAWVHCWSPNAAKSDVGHLDIFSMNALGLDHMQVNLDGGELEAHGHGLVWVPPATPNFAYATALDKPTLYKVNVHTHASTPLNLSSTGCSGFYRMSISPQNKHAYMRCYVCCSCGNESYTQVEDDGTESLINAPGDNGVACAAPGARGAPSVVTKATGEKVRGMCGHSCENTRADTVGVVEYNLLDEAVVATHPKAMGDPQASPLGDIVIALGHGGDTKQHVLLARQNGEASIDGPPIALDFTAGTTSVVASDVDFIETDTHAMAVFSSTLDNHLVLADLTDMRNDNANPHNTDTGMYDVNTRTISISEKEAPTSNHGRGARRRVVSDADGTHLVVTANKVDQLHFLSLGTSGSLDDVAVIKDVADVHSTTIIYIPRTSGGTGGAGTNGKDGTHGINGKDGSVGKEGSNGKDGAAADEKDDNDNKENNTLATVALVLGVVGVLLGAAALFVAMRASNTAALACLSGNNKVGGHIRLTEPDVDNATMNRTKGPATGMADQI